MGRITDALRKMSGGWDNEGERNKKGKNVSPIGQVSDSTATKEDFETMIKDQPGTSDFSYPKVLFGEVSPTIFSYYEIGPSMIEELRHIASSLENSGVKLFLITSASPGEGKTVFSLNQAIVISRYLGKRVLYVDGDFRAIKTSLTYLDLPESKLVGLGDILLNNSSIDSAIVATEVDGLYILPRGQRIPLSRISQDAMARLFYELRDRFDFIFVDSSPVRMFSDARILAPFVDAAIVVAAMNRTPRGSVRHAVQLLKDSKCSKVFFVLNGIINYIPGLKSNNSYYYKSYAK